MGRPPSKAVFLDRDGTLNAEQGPIADLARIRLLPGASEAVTRLHAAGYALVVVTNQSGIARGLYDEIALARVHEQLHQQCGRKPLAWLHCPHLPELQGPYGGTCRCRKPGPGLIEQALELFRLEPEGSFVIGDSARDLQMIGRLPMAGILVQCGKPWERELAALTDAGTPPYAVVKDLGAAARLILGQ